jgi:hypothetical protein
MNDFWEHAQLTNGWLKDENRRLRTNLAMAEGRAAHYRAWCKVSIAGMVFLAVAMVLL